MTVQRDVENGKGEQSVDETEQTEHKRQQNTKN